MLPGLTLPGSLVAPRPCFTAPSFRTFCGLAAGLAGQPRRRTVVGMLLGAGLSRAWPHDRAHYFFARARWEIDELGPAVARLAVLLVPVGAPLMVAVDDSLFRRARRKVYGAGWQYDGSSPAQDKLSFGTCFVVAGIVVHLPFLARPVCLPVLGRLVPHGGKTGRAAKGGTKTTAGGKKDSAPGSKTAAAVALITLLAAAFPDRPVQVVADALYHGPALKQLPATVTWTTRLPPNAVPYALAPALPLGRHGSGRPPRQGQKAGHPRPARRRRLGPRHRARLRRQPDHRPCRRHLPVARRRGPHPHPPRRRAHRPVRPAHPRPGHHLVRPPRTPSPDHHRPPRQPALVHHQDRP
jgi:hypothetical protein